MLTADSCRTRRLRLLAAHPGPLVLTDPLNLRYFAGFDVDPMSISADFGGVLVIEPDGSARLHYDARVPKSSINACQVDEKLAIGWYDGKSPGHGPRRLILQDAIHWAGGRVHDSLTDPLAEPLWKTIADLRRAKDPDEIIALKACMRATEAGHLWARNHLRPGMSEVEAYAGVASAATVAASRAVVVYGDFTVSPGSAVKGGPPTSHVLAAGEMFILDFSVILGGYRSDFTNTLVVGGEPMPAQAELLQRAQAAMAAGEARLRAGAECLAVYDAVKVILGDAFPHHAGHGLGLTHPEAPFFVERATETLVAGDVVTLEPGVYIDGVGGLRIEHNYLITDTGYERLSNHTIALT